MKSLDDFAAQRLAALEAENLRRTLAPTARHGGVRVERGGRSYISFSCNDYLGLAQDPRVIAAGVDALQTYGASAGASRLVTGDHPLLGALEAKLAAFKKTEAAVVFGSGYLTNTGIVPALAEAGDLILLDDLCHSCMAAGARLSGARILRFKHNDLQDLQDILSAQRQRFRRVLILTERVFSMDGDRAPEAALLALAEDYDSWVLIDDAHGVGVVQPEAYAPLEMGTLSKALGSYGGYVCTSAPVADLLRNQARSFVFSTGLPPASAGAAIAALEIVQSEPARGARALAQARRLTLRLNLPDAQSAIVPFVVGDAGRALALSRALQDQGFLVVAIRPPTVPKDTARLRIAFSSAHKEEEVDALAEAIAKAAPDLLEPGLMKQLIFVAGTGTDIGKTYISAGLIRAAKAHGQKVVALKPILSGAPDVGDPAFAETDAAKFLEALQQPLDEAHVNAISPWRFQAPLSPDMAAHLEGRSVQFDALLDWTRAHVRGAPQGSLVLVEGAGGLMSPLTPKNTNLDLLAALGARVLLVCGNYLGAISHTLTAVESLKARNAELAAIVINESAGDNPPLESTMETMARFLPDVRIAPLPRGDKPEGLLHLL